VLNHADIRSFLFGSWTPRHTHGVKGVITDADLPRPVLCEMCMHCEHMSLSSLFPRLAVGIRSFHLHVPFRLVRCLFLLLSILLTLLGGLAQADLVMLKNGDPVRGKILAMEDEKLKLDTDFAGVIYIDWDDIERIDSDQPLTLIFHSGADIPEGVGNRDGDRLIVSRIEAGGPIPMSTVKAINPASIYYRGNINLGGNQTTGNSETQAFNLSGNFTLRKDRSRLNLTAKHNRGEAKGQTTAQNASGGFRYDYYLSRQVYVIADQLFESDQFQNLTLRTTSTAGLGYDFFDQKSRSLSLGAGPTCVYQDFSTESATVTPAFTWMLSWYQELRGGDIKLFHKHQGFQDVGTSTAFRLNADQGIRVKVWGDLSLNVEYNIRYNSQPAAGRKELDTTFIFGVSYEFKS
jgi:putative salt-induced outer membrane protein YdiY